MEHNETGCQAPKAPKFCINNCGFFGSSTTMNMCSKCHKDHVLKQQQAMLAASSIESMVAGGASSEAEAIISVKADAHVSPVQLKVEPAHPLEGAASAEEASEAKPEEGPKRCSACSKRVGLMGFTCRCGNLFCAAHRHSDKHNCQFDYRAVGRDAIAKANPIVKADKLEKI